MSIKLILTHPGGAHKDDYLACSLLVAQHGAPIERREPEQDDLDDSSVLVVDVGGEHEPDRGNFDHHQFPRDHDPICALSLVLQDLGLYEDAKMFCEGSSPRSGLTPGSRRDGQVVGVDRDIISKLNSPMDVTLLRRFAQAERLDPGDLLYEMMRWVGEDLLEYLKTLRERLTFIGKHGELWTLEANGGDSFKVLFMPRTNPLPAEPSVGLGRYLDSIGEAEDVAGLVYPDRRGSGYGLSRHNDHPRMEFTRIGAEDDAFAHARGFVAKTSATEKERLKELLRAAWV